MVNHIFISFSAVQIYDLSYNNSLVDKENVTNKQSMVKKPNLLLDPLFFQYVSTSAVFDI